MSGFSMVYVIYAAAALTGIMIAEAFYMLYAGRSDRRAAINRRMKLQENKISQEQVLIQLRKERGLESALVSFASIASARCAPNPASSCRCRSSWRSRRAWPWRSALLAVW